MATDMEKAEEALTAALGYARGVEGYQAEVVIACTRAVVHALFVVNATLRDVVGQLRRLT